MMFISYVRRHGWKRSLGALANVLVLVAALSQAAGLMAITSAKDFYQGISARSGFGDGPLFGSPVVDWLLSPVGVLVLALGAVALIIKEFLLSPLSRRLAINGIVLVLGLIATAYVAYVLYVVPVDAVGSLKPLSENSSLDH